jgi:hypothetical protein
VNRKDLQILATLRLREARSLYRAREFSGAYYLAGYAVECGLKACIAKKVLRHDFPDHQQKGKDPYVHNLAQLAILADLKDEIRRVADADTVFDKNWDIAVLWNEQSRYRVISPTESKQLIDAIMEKRHGVMPWVRRHW